MRLYDIRLVFAHVVSHQAGRPEPAKTSLFGSSEPFAKDQQAKRVRNLLNDQRKEALEVGYSPLRYEYLRRTIELLSTTGNVRVVRLPISRPLLAIEDSLMPDFNERMRRLADQMDVPYIDFTDSVDRYTYTDGGHVDQTTARSLSKLIATGQPNPAP